MLADIRDIFVGNTASRFLVPDDGNTCWRIDVEQEELWRMLTCFVAQGPKASHVQDLNATQ